MRSIWLLTMRVEALGVGRRGDAGVVDHDVEPAVAGDGVVDRGVEGGRVGHVEHGGLAADLVGHRLCAASALRSLTTTVAPSAARRRAKAAPSPEPAPVMKATRPSSPPCCMAGS